MLLTLAACGQLLKEWMPAFGSVDVHLERTSKDANLVAEGVFLPSNRVFKINHGDPTKINKDAFEALSATYTAVGLLRPELDSRAWRSVLADQRPLLIVADTSAVCSGSFHWLSQTLWHRRIDVVTMSVVERELFGWADQDDFWDDIKLSTKYRVARRASETPLPNVTDLRPPPDEKAALMLAKIKVKEDIKSPDADILLIEFARDYMRTQSPHVQSLFVTGDRNHARSAVNVLPASTVLYCPMGSFDAKKELVGSCAFWQPSHGDGAIHLAPFERIVWLLMAFYKTVSFRDGNRKLVLRHHTQGLGVPSDWTEPYLEIQSSTVDTTRKLSGQSNKRDQPEPSGAAKKNPKIKPAASHFLNYLNDLIEGHKIESPLATEESNVDTLRLLQMMEVIDDQYRPKKTDELLTRVKTNNWDGVAELVRVWPGFESALGDLSKGSHLGRAGEAAISLARRLGQAAKLARNGPTLRGDAPISQEELKAYLVNLIGSSPDSVPFEFVCERLLKDRHVTPARFEKKFQELNDSGDNPFQWETGGTTGGYGEPVYVFDGNRVRERLISPSALTFGGSRSYRSMRKLT